MATNTTNKGTPGSKGTSKTTANATDRSSRETATVSMRERPSNPGFVSHTELASSDPAATRQWAQKTLGWSFGDAVPTPTGPYHMWRHESPLSGGGIRGTNAGEPAGTTPFVEVEDIQATYKAALKNGAQEMYPPMEVPNGGRIACVKAPGGPAIGLWSPK